jgi:predicted amidohydrolase
MKIAIIQSVLHWENIEANLQMFEEKINTLQAGVDLILLPEMFSTGFSMHPEKTAEPMDGQAISWMKKIAAEKKCTDLRFSIYQRKGSIFQPIRLC